MCCERLNISNNAKGAFNVTVPIRGNLKRSTYSDGNTYDGEWQDSKK